LAKIQPGVGPQYPQVVILVGATGDLARRKLLPGLFHLASSGFIPGCRIIGVSLDSLDTDGFRQFARDALTEFSTRNVAQADWDAFSNSLQYVPLKAGAAVLKAAVLEAEHSFGVECRRLHYLSVPPNAALSAVRLLGEAELVDRARVIMEKPFGTDLASAVLLNSRLHEVFDEERIFRIDHFLGKEAAQNILAFRFANGLFEPIWNRNFIDHVQIDVPEKLGLGKRSGFYEQTGAYRDMVVTHLFQILGFMAMESPTSLEPKPISEEKTKSSAACCRSSPPMWCAANIPDTDRRKGSPPTRIRRHSLLCDAISTIGAGPVCPSTYAPVSAWPRGNASFRLPFESRRRACFRPVPESASKVLTT